MFVQSVTLRGVHFELENYYYYYIYQSNNSGDNTIYYSCDSN